MKKNATRWNERDMRPVPCEECGQPLARRDQCTDDTGRIVCRHCLATILEQSGTLTAAKEVAQ